MSEITIRTSRPTDASELRRLAALDSQVLPTGDLLVAEQGGEIVAAHGAGRTVADPFRRTADVVSLLELRAHGGGPATRRPRGRLFPVARAA